MTFDHSMTLLKVGFGMLALNLALVYLFNAFCYEFSILAPFCLIFGTYSAVRIAVLGNIDVGSYNILDILVAISGMALGMILYGYFKWGVYAGVFGPVEEHLRTLLPEFQPVGPFSLL